MNSDGNRRGRSADGGAVQYATCARAKEIKLRYSGVMSVVVEPDFRWWWIGRVRNREGQPLQRGSWPRTFGGIAGVVTGSAGVRCLCGRMGERACVRLYRTGETERRGARGLDSRGDRFDFRLGPVELSGMCRLLEAREELFLVPRAGEDVVAEGSSRL